MTAVLPAALAEIDGYSAQTRVFLGTTPAVYAVDEFEACLRMRMADAGAGAAMRAADESAMPSLADFLRR